MVRVIGIDPGLNYTGWGIVEEVGGQYRYVASGVCRPPKGELALRLGVLANQLQTIITEHVPTLGACEKTFVNVNPQSTLLLGQARGCAITVMAMDGLDVREYTPSEIKLAVTGTGKADKTMVSTMVCRLLGLTTPLQEDEADALGCAITALNAHKMQAIQTQGVTKRTYATARRGKTDRGARQAWTALLSKEGK